MAGPPRARLTVTTPSDREIVMTRVFDAPARLVFDAWTKPEHLMRWFGQAPQSGGGESRLRGWTMPVCEVDLRVGGSWRYELHGPGGERMRLYGVYKEIDPPRLLVSTENFDDFQGGDFGMGGETLNTMTLEEDKGRTTLTLTSLYESKEARDGVLKTGMEFGAAENFDRLDEVLRTLVSG